MNPSRNYFTIVSGFVAAIVCLAVSAGAAPADLQQLVKGKVNEAYPALESLYKHFHLNPELSLREEKTSVRLADELERLGFTVTRRVGGYGIVAVLKNGDGPTVLVRTDMDALPVTEQTGAPYASKVTTTDEKGNTVGVMHACGHDLHMTSLVGTAQLLTQIKDRWRGTLVLIGQPAEEKVQGARAMLADGLFTKFPKPDFCLALHVNAILPAGSVGYVEGFMWANVDSVNLSIRGVGGHGAYPHMTKDPIVLAAQTILALQTIVSREKPPLEAAVVTVGSIHGGTKHNIIPDEVRLQLTVRSYSDEVRTHTLEAIKRISRGLAQAAGLPEDRYPLMTLEDESAPATYNDPELARRMSKAFKSWLGEDRTIQMKPVMGAEDFSLYGRTEHKIPICMFSLGVVEAQQFKEHQNSGKALPSLHSPIFLPDREPAIKTGVTAMTAAVLELLGK